MARIRSLKIGFFENEALSDLPMSDRLLFAGLWLLADREGRMEDRPKRIKASLFPYDDVDADAALSRLEQAGFIARYTVDGLRLLEVCNFQRHQKPHPKEQASTLPCRVIPRQKTAQPRKTTAQPETATAEPGKDASLPGGLGDLCLGDLGLGDLGVREPEETPAATHTPAAPKIAHPRQRYARPIAQSSLAHEAHAWCSERIPCVPNFTAQDFAKRIGGDPSTVAKRLGEFYVATEAAHVEFTPIPEDGPKYWRAKFEAWLKAQAPAPRPVAVEETPLSALLDRTTLNNFNRASWFGAARLDGCLLTVRDNAAAEWISRHYRDELEAAFGGSLEIVARNVAVSA